MCHVDNLSAKRDQVKDIAREGVFVYMESSNQTELFDRIKRMIIKAARLKIPPERIENAKPLFGPEGIGLDSIDALELVLALEKEFGARIPDSSVDKKILVSVESIAKFILKNGRGKSA